MMTFTFSSPRFVMAFAVGVMICLGKPEISRSQEAELLPVETAPAPSTTPFGVGGAARKALPGLDCWRCPGPAPCAPCGACGRGLLYYGATPWGRHSGGWCECAHGDGGHFAACLSRAWIHLFEGKKRPLPCVNEVRCGCATCDAKTSHR